MFQSHIQSTSDRVQYNDLQSLLCATLQVMTLSQIGDSWPVSPFSVTNLCSKNYFNNNSILVNVRLTMPVLFPLYRLFDLPSLWITYKTVHRRWILTRKFRCQPQQIIYWNVIDRVQSYVLRLRYLLGGCPFNGPLSGTKYPTRAASPIQNASTPKSSLPFSKHRSCAQVLVEPELLYHRAI